ncbi:phosphopantetheine-binding protein [Ancylomarina sp. YFZ004]
MEELIKELKENIIIQLKLEDYTINDIGTDDLLFGDSLGLDSIDAIELIVLLERNYKIKIEDPKEARNILMSVKTMAEYIHEHVDQH